MAPAGFTARALGIPRTGALLTRSMELSSLYYLHKTWHHLLLHPRLPCQHRQAAPLASFALATSSPVMSPSSSSSSATSEEDATMAASLLDKLRIRQLKYLHGAPKLKTHTENSVKKKKMAAPSSSSSPPVSLPSSFVELPLSDELTAAIDELGLTQPTEVQCRAIPAVLDGQSVVIASHTGSGKTLAYMIPLVQVLEPKSASLALSNKASLNPDIVVLSSGGLSDAQRISAVRFAPASQLSLLGRTPWTYATFGRAYASAAESRKREIRVSDEADDDNDGEFEDDSDVEDEQRIEDSDDEEEEEEEEDQELQSEGPAKKKVQTKPLKPKFPDQQGRALNEKIMARTLRLVNDDGRDHRIVSRDEALSLAKQKKMDLVLVDGRSDPPVCKIYDFNKEEYKQEQILKDRKKQKGSTARLNEVKELRFNSKTESKDLKMKVEQAKEFMNRGHRVKVNPDQFKLSEATLRSVHQEPNEDEEEIFGELYRELVEADTRATRSRRGRGRGIRVGGRGKGLLIRRTSGSVGTSEGEAQTYRRRGSSSSNPIAHDDIPPPPREPSFDDDGNEISHSEDEDESAFVSSSEESSSNSLDEHSGPDSDGLDEDSFGLDSDSS